MGPVAQYNTQQYRTPRCSTTRNVFILSEHYVTRQCGTAQYYTKQYVLLTIRSGKNATIQYRALPDETARNGTCYYNRQKLFFCQ